MPPSTFNQQDAPGPLMHRIIRTAYLAAAAGFFLITGSLLHAIPERELSYNEEVMNIPCGRPDCGELYRLTIGNTGRRSFEDIELCLAREVFIGEPPKIKNSGVVPRRVPSRIEGGRLFYAMGQLEPGKTVVLDGLIHNGQSDSVLCSIDPEPAAAVRRQSPQGLRLSRFLFALYSLF